MTPNGPLMSYHVNGLKLMYLISIILLFAIFYSIIGNAVLNTSMHISDNFLRIILSKSVYHTRVVYTILHAILYSFINRHRFEEFTSYKIQAFLSFDKIHWLECYLSSSMTHMAGVLHDIAPKYHLCITNAH